MADEEEGAQEEGEEESLRTIRERTEDKLGKEKAEEVEDREDRGEGDH